MGWRAVLLEVTRSPRAEDQHPLRPVQLGELLRYYLQRPPGQEQQLSQRPDQTVTRVRLDHHRSPDVAPAQQPCLSQAPYLAVDGAERCIETLREVGHAVLSLGEEQQRGEDVGLQLRPEDRQQRRRGASHNLKVSTIYSKCQAG